MGNPEHGEEYLKKVVPDIKNAAQQGCTPAKYAGAVPAHPSEEHRDHTGTASR